MMCSFKVLAKATSETGINQKGMIYTDLIADCLLLCLSSFDGLIQQNNAATLCMQVTQNWLQEHLVDLQGFHWSPRLSDFNSVEHIWDMLQSLVHSLKSYPTNTTQHA